MNSLYNNHSPTVSHTLEQFINRLNNLFLDGENYAFIRTGLTGEYINENGETRQIFIDPAQNNVDAGHDLKFTRDYDSAIGISDVILVDAAINIYAVPHPTFALTSSIHLKYPIERSDGRTEHVEFHQIPNFELGTFGPRHHLNIFFPGLWSKERSKSSTPYRVTERERAFWYEKGLCPAIQHLLGAHNASEWPATYETEEIRARKSRGGHTWATKMIPAHAVGQLMDRVRLTLGRDMTLDREDVAWAQGCFVMHTIRGLKHATRHDAYPEEATFHLDQFFLDAKLSPNASNEGSWWIDVGIEISSEEGECLQWKTSAHLPIVEYALRTTHDHARRITRINSSKYSRDLSSHLTALSGFRITPGKRAQGEFETAYIQAYTTDKAVVYNPDGSHHAKFVTAKEALGPVQPSKTIDGIHTIYEKARENNNSNGRLEVRVPYHFATQTLVDLNEDLFRDSLCAFTCETWWNFRIVRLMAISQILTLQEDGSSSLRFMPETLLLTAACIWLVNSLHARPEDGPASRDLMQAVLPLTEVTDATVDIIAFNTRIRPEWQHEDEESDPDEPATLAVPYNPYGCLFFRRIMLREGEVDVPRFRCGGRNISPPSFSFFFNGMTLEQVQGKYQRSGVVSRAALAETCLTNKSSMIQYVNTTGAPEPNLFDLREQGYSLAPPSRDDGSDLEDRPTPPPEDGPQDIDARLSAIWRQFVRDLTVKSPNQRGIANPSHVRLDREQRESASEAPYKHLRLPEVFNAVWYKNATPQQWRTSFDYLFPPLNYRISSDTQNYPTCKYYRDWTQIREDNRHNPKLIEELRDQFFERIRQWSWMPFAQCDRMWQTSAKKPSSRPFTRWPPAPDRPPAPHILLHSRDVPVLEVQNDGTNRTHEEV